MSESSGDREGEYEVNIGERERAGEATSLGERGGERGRGGILGQIPGVSSLHDIELRQLLNQMMQRESLDNNEENARERERGIGEREREEEEEEEEEEREWNGEWEGREENGSESESLEEGRDRMQRMEAQAQALEGSVLELVGDAQSLGQWLSKALPLSLLLAVFLGYHGSGILLFLWHSAVMLHCSHLLVTECRKNVEQREPPRAIAALFLSLLHSAVVLSTLFSLDSLSSLWFLPPTHEHSFWDILWLVCINDVFARFAAISVKAFVVMVYRNPSKRKLGLLMSAVEMASVYYRVCLPAPVWLRFYLHQADVMWPPAVALLICVYLLFKIASAFRAGHRFLAAGLAFFHGSLPFGTLPSEEELLEAGRECSICRDEMGAPLKLGCGHIFCEDCVTEWFHRKRTCPLCRAAVETSSGQRTYGDGSTNMVLYIF